VRIIAGAWGGRRIHAPKGRDTRPTADRIREAWMSAMAPAIPDARVLDLFAGSGALGLECLSRGAAEAVFVERARGALSVLRANIDALDAGDRTRIVSGDVFRFLERTPLHAFDLALADPPYDRGYASRLVELFHRAPFARELWVEHRTGESLPPVEGLHTRRYGDTSISILEAQE
jgi:16S rRNA (guanine966-N2)-methyltransferase